jgi:HTH-type transcriptional regulator / antitoxin HipB
MRSNGSARPAQALAAALRDRRKALGITQIELARLARCGPDFIYDVESAKPTLRLDKLLDVLEVLGLELVLREGKSRLRVDAGKA